MSKLTLVGFGSCVSAALVTSLTFSLPTLSHEKGKISRTIAVNGRGVEMIATSSSRVNIGVLVEAKTSEYAQKQAATRSAAVVKYLRSNAVEKLQTTGIALNPVYKYTNNVRQITGYRATNQVTFIVNTERMGKILDGVVKAGATQINNISFTATDKAIADAQKKALQEAVQNAQSQAQVVLTSLQLTPKEVVNITINSGNTAPPPIFRNNVAAAAPEATTPVIAGQQRVEASVTLTIRY